MQDVGKLPQTLESYGDHMGSWVKACKEGTPTASNFDFAAAVTEVALLGSIALRHGKKLQWDGQNMRISRRARGRQVPARRVRKGWEV